jgi:corrinoid protein of di/trimethylamine methyltransferase
MPDDLLTAMRQAVVDCAPDTAAALARSALERGLDPLATIQEGFVLGLNEVGEQFARRELFLPDLMMAAEAMRSATAVLEPEIVRRGSRRESRGIVILGTVKGDIHEIGKNLVATVLTASGFEVHDLGVDVAPERFAAAVAEFSAGVVGLSSLLTTTMARQRTVVAALTIAGVRDRVKVIVGGAPVTRAWAAEIGADGYAPNALAALDLVRSLLQPAAAAL